MVNVQSLVTEVTRRATAKNPRAKQGEVGIASAANLVRVTLEMLAGMPAGEVGALLSRYRARRA